MDPAKPVTPRWLLLWVAAIGCHGSPPTVPAATIVSGPHVLYSANPLDPENPFPDARLLALDGGLSSRAQAFLPFVPAASVQQGGQSFQTYVAAQSRLLSQLSGFGNFGGELLPFSESIAPESLAASVFLVLLAGVPAAPALGPAARVSYFDAPPFALVEPSLPLAGAATYALVVTDQAQTAAGKALARSTDFDAWAQADGKAPLDQVAQALGIPVTQVIFAMVFVTQDARKDLTALAGWAAQPLPDFDADAGLSVPSPPLTSCANVGSDIQCPQGVFTADAGTLSVLNPWLRRSISDGGAASGAFQDPPTEVGTVVAGTMTLKDARDAEDGHFQQAVVENPALGRDVDRAFVLVLPDPDNPSTPLPPAGYPLVLVGHPLGGSNSLSLTGGNPSSSLCVILGQLFAEAGYGCLGIDAPSHGTRGNPLAFFRVDDLSITRDYFREMAFDQLQVLRIAASGLLAQFGPPIDPQNLRYVGASLGGIMGATFLALDSRSLGGVLNVPGGGLTHIFQSPTIFSGISLLLELQIGIPSAGGPDGGVNPNYQATIPFLTTVAQAILESADPINYAPAMPAAKHVLMQEGLLDRTVPNLATNDLAAALGVATIEQDLTDSGNPVSGLWKYNLTRYGLNPRKVDPHMLFELVPGARTQASHYLQTNQTEILAE